MIKVGFFFLLKISSISYDSLRIKLQTTEKHEYMQHEKEEDHQRLIKNCK